MGAGMFSQADTNKDGEVSKDEAIEGMAKRFKERAESGEGGGGRPGGGGGRPDGGGGR